MNALPPIVLCLGLLGAAGVAAQTYRVGVESQPYQPYYSLEAGEYQGYARDLLDAFAADQGHRFIYVALPVKRLQSDFLSGKLDFKYPDHPHWNREQKQGRTVHYSAATAPYRDGVLVLPAYLGLGKARIKLLGTQLGFTPWPFLTDIEGGQIALTQTTRIETGQHGTYLRNSLLLKFQLQPALTLDTGVELRRDSEISGRNQTDARLNLRYVF